MPYTLITVTNDGRVHHARGFETLRMCQEARSIALTGLTIAENDDRRAALKRCEEERRAREAESIAQQWRLRHPPRHPTPDEARGLRRLVLAWGGKNGATQYFRHYEGTVGLRYARSTLGADGLIYDWPQELHRTWEGRLQSMTWMPEPDPGAIRHAVCVIEMPDAPGEAMPAAA